MEWGLSADKLTEATCIYAIKKKESKWVSEFLSGMTVGKLTLHDPKDMVRFLCPGIISANLYWIYINPELFMFIKL